MLTPDKWTYQKLEDAEFRSRSRVSSGKRDRLGGGFLRLRSNIEGLDKKAWSMQMNCRRDV